MVFYTTNNGWIVIQINKQVMKTFKEKFKISASPEELFSALTNPSTIELWSGYPAVMDAKENMEFSLWDGDISGRNLKIHINRQLIQEWYFGDQVEQSIVTINLEAVKTGTLVELSHTNIPDEAYEDISEGWKKYYWGAIKRFFK